MKKCPYCGQEYSDEYSVCATDEYPLESSDPKPPPPASDSETAKAEEPGTVDEERADAKAPDGFLSLGRFDAFEADSLLKKFVAAGIRFQIDRIEKRVFTGGWFSGTGYVTRDWIEIFVSGDDEEQARKILTADWKV